MAMTFAVDDPSTEPSTEGTKAGVFDVEWRAGLSSYLGHPRIKAAKGWLENLRRVVSSRAQAVECVESERLSLEVVRLYEDGLYYEAEIEARRLVDHQKETVGEDHPDFATALSNLALLLQRQGDLKGAEALLARTMEIRRETLGEQHPDFAASLNNLALLLCERSDLDDAEPLFRQGLEIRRATLGETHPDYATGLSSLALVLCARHDLDGAEPLLRQALEIRRNALGEEHPDFATSLNNLALLLCERSDLDGAEPLLRQALAIRQGVLGSQHADTLSSAESLSRLLVKTGRSGEPDGAEFASEFLPPLPGASDPQRFEAFVADPGTTDVAAGSPQSQIAVGPGPLQVETEARDARVLLEELADLANAFTNASEGLLQEAASMQASGLPPDPLVLASASACHLTFSNLRAEARRRAEMVALPASTPREAASLDALEGLLYAIAEAEVDWTKQEATRRSALSLLEAIGAFSCRAPEDQPLLAGCQAQATELHTAISTCPPSQLPPDADRLAAGDHPLARVVALVLNPENVNEEDWARLYDEAATTFGKGFAVAVARGRVSPRA